MQLASADMVHDPADAVAFNSDPALPETMAATAAFLLDNGLPGEEDSSAHFVAVACRNASAAGDPYSMRLRHDDTCMRVAVDASLRAVPATLPALQDRGPAPGPPEYFRPR
jgi:NitT/TauT family transport system substrate-binding protein